jgi:hypothetical protein
MPEAPSAVERKMRQIPAAPFSFDDVLRRRHRRDRRRRVATVVLALGLFVPVVAWFALESGHPDVTPTDGSQARAAFVREAGSICARGRAEFRQATPLVAPQGDWSFSRTVAYYRKGLEIFQEVVSRLRRLTPPPELADRFEAAVAAHERSIETTSEAVAAADTGNRRAFHRLIHRTFGPIDVRLRTAYDRVDPGIDCP